MKLKHNNFEEIDHYDQGDFWLWLDTPEELENDHKL